ncbi:hypothetical protein AAV32_09540 [Kerstersia gyiorum]|uniref:DUF4760 domain-containing protein n=2 Tax=Kerstersia gyiorum TaxID=206506 RepID=A0A171KSE2_9BURK|nr:hypothetical protein AAV32_09540 [Kerstersia gyiorum]
MAAWVQAIGVIAALFVSIWISGAERRSRKIEKQQEQADRDKAAIAWCQKAMGAVESANRIINVEKDHRSYYDGVAEYDPEYLRSLERRLQEVGPEHLSHSLVDSFLKFEDCFRRAMGYIHMLKGSKNPEYEILLEEFTQKVRDAFDKLLAKNKKILGKRDQEGMWCLWKNS